LQVLVLFGLHPSESPCEEEHMHWGSHVEVPVYKCRSSE
jgi:hypothetical protein